MCRCNAYANAPEQAVLAAEKEIEISSKLALGYRVLDMAKLFVGTPAKRSVLPSRFASNTKACLARTNGHLKSRHKYHAPIFTLCEGPVVTRRPGLDFTLRAIVPPLDAPFPGWQLRKLLQSGFVHPLSGHWAPGGLPRWGMNGPRRATSFPYLHRILRVALPCALA